MIFISAGHNPKGIKPDPGAVANGYHEADLAVQFRNLVASELSKLGAQFVTDNDDERLAQYLERIKTGGGSVVLEFHFDAAASSTATGTTALVGDDADRLDLAFAKKLAEATALHLNIKNRGVLSESSSHRGRLGLMRESGTVALLELCFISNQKDLQAYMSGKEKLASAIAKILVEFEAMV